MERKLEMAAKEVSWGQMMTASQVKKCTERNAGLKPVRTEI